MPSSRVLYWNKPWPGHVALVIDYGAGEQTIGHMTLFADYMNVPPEYAPEMPIGLLGLRNYVSWTAGEGGNALTGIRAYAKTYEEDFIKCHGPSHKSAEIKNLDVDAMYTEWNAIRTKQGATWKILGKNCACVVLRVLRAGGCDQHVRSYMKRNPAIITPQAVWEYAKAAAASTNGTVRHGRPN